jgi:hypothetical protein
MTTSSGRRVAAPLMAALGVALPLVGGARVGGAQTVGPPPVYAPPFPGRVTAANTVTIGGAFAHAPASPPLVLTGTAGSACNPGACFRGTITVRANSRWQLQLKTTAPDPAGYKVAHVSASGPAGIAYYTPGSPDELSSQDTRWKTVASGTGATAGAGITLNLLTIKAGGRSGTVPTAAQLQAVMMYRVVALP